jgi:hypothetical protein
MVFEATHGRFVMRRILGHLTFSVVSIVLIATALGVSGCTDAEIARNAAAGSQFKVTVYSGGQAVKTYVSTGKVLSEEKSDGWFFMDKATNKLVRVSGTITVEQE